MYNISFGLLFVLQRKNKYKSALINMTAQCMHMNIGAGVSNEISVPYMSVYEASNAFGFYSNSVSRKPTTSYNEVNIVN